MSNTPDVHGLEGVEVLEDEHGRPQRRLRLHFLPETDEDGRDSLSSLIEHVADSPRRVRLVAEPGLPDVRVEELEAHEKRLDVNVDRPGGHAPYTLELLPGPDAPATLDPRLSRARFSFKAGCPTPVDDEPPRADDRPATSEAGRVDYMAKDYASFRRLLEDLAERRLPDGYERIPADLLTTLVELLAHAGDHLSYYQDAVANEAYLETARKRTSVRRHARLIDYRMHDGASARTLVHVRPAGEGLLPAGTQLLTPLTEPLRPGAGPPGPLVASEDAHRARQQAAAVFETVREARVHPELNDVAFHTWGNEDCRLAEGATRADLSGNLTDVLAEGDLLLFEEFRDPSTGIERTGEHARRHVVRLRDVRRREDPLADDPQDGAVTRVAWDREDALPFPIHVVRDVEVEGERDEDVVLARARGNLVLADHGETVTEWHPSPASDTHAALAGGPPSEGIELGDRPYRFELSRGPLSFRLVPPEDGDPGPASHLLDADPRHTLPEVRSVEARSADGDAIDTWKPAERETRPGPDDTRGRDLLDSDPFDTHVAVDTTDRGRARVRFGDDTHGRSPPDDARLLVTYRVGRGPEGNVAAGALQHLVVPADVSDEWPSWIAGDEEEAGRVVHNPLAAWGGTEPESIERVKRVAPSKIDEEPLRAVTEDDYRKVTERHPEVARAAATFRWTGSWHSVLVAVDPRARSRLPPELRDDVEAWVRDFAQAGTDVQVRGPDYVPVEIHVEATAERDRLAADVRREIETALSDRKLADGGQGLFHPENWSFGDTLRLSHVYAAVEEVDGVAEARVTVFRPLHRPEADTLERGRIDTGPFEVVRLDDDPDRPRNGVLHVEVTPSR